MRKATGMCCSLVYMCYSLVYMCVYTHDTRTFVCRRVDCFERFVVSFPPKDLYTHMCVCVCVCACVCVCVRACTYIRIYTLERCAVRVDYICTHTNLQVLYMHT